MNQNRIVVSTTKSLHDPIEVEIDGQVYVVRMNKAIFQKFADAEQKIKDNPAGTFDSFFILYEEVELMTGAPREIVESLDFHELRAIINFVMEKYYGKKVDLASTALTPPDTASAPPNEEKIEKNE